MDKKELWLKLANYHFDHLAPAHLWDVIAAKFGGQNPYTRAFADKLARKLRWNKLFAMKAIWEYKKFVYLGVISDFGVTPSKIIDQVWHEHLLFSAGYRKFCKDVINYDFDHHPELTAISTQTEAFISKYFQTIELYEKEFGAKPPGEIWDIKKFKWDNTKVKKYSKNKSNGSISASADGDSVTLVSMFPSSDSSTFEFGGGESGGGGAGGSWDDGSGDSSSGDSGSDSGGSDGGSSCSSGCGGGD